LEKDRREENSLEVLPFLFRSTRSKSDKKKQEQRKKKEKKGKKTLKKRERYIIKQKETWRERNDSLGQHIIKEKRKKERKKPFLPFTKYTFDKFIIKLCLSIS
jgi:acyl-CoA reductase-like NAD-dependent aldehyde dehydrogenase